MLSAYGTYKIITEVLEDGTEFQTLKRIDDAGNIVEDEE